MKAFWKAGVAGFALLVGGAALAGDLPSAKLPPAPKLPDFHDWSGFHLGLQTGIAWDRQESRLRRPGALAPSTGLYHPETGLGGVHAGFDLQWGAFVLGIEGDVEVVNAAGGFNDGRLIGRVGRDWQASLRGRAGYALDTVLFYVTAGAAFSEFDYRFHDPAGGFSATASLQRTGWTVGAGVNYALTRHLVLGAEYRYTDFGGAAQAVALPPAGLAAAHDSSQHALRASFAYKF